MPYRVENIAYSRRGQDGLSRRLSGPLKKLSSRLRIGGQRIPVGKPVTISDEVYAAEKSEIDGYAAGGLISLKMTAEAPKVEPPKPKRRTRGKAKPKVVKPIQEVAPPVVAPPVISPAPPVVQEAPEAPIEKEAKESRLFRRLRKKSE